MSTPKRVFISYGTADASSAAAWMQSELSKLGYAVWRDKDELRDGEDWAERIEHELVGADAVVALLSPHAVRRGGECRNEIGIAKDRRKTIVPVMVRRCEPPLRIYELQRVDLEEFDSLPSERRQEQLRRIVEAIERGVPDDPGIQQVRAVLPRLDFQWMFGRHERFVGREWLLDSFDRWLEEGSEPALFLIGPAGIGKSAALCRWVQTRMDIGAVHFCRSDRSDLRDPVKMVASIASQLVTIERELPGYAESILAPALDAARHQGSADRAAELFDRLVCDPIRRLEGGRKWVLVVDALDEGGPAIAHLLADCVRQSRLPPNLRLLVSSRPEPSLLGLFPNKHVIKAQGAENLDDLGAYALSRSQTIADLHGWSPDRAARIAEQVVANAGGLFSFAVSAMDSLQAGSMSPSDLDSLSEGDEALYLSIFSKLFPSPDDFDAIAGMLEVIVSSPNPVSDAFIASVLDVPQRAVSRELGKLGSLLREVEGVRIPFHKSLVDWLKVGTGGRHPFGIQPLDGVRRMRAWHDRSRDPESALLVADALLETRQPRAAVEVLRGARESGEGSSLAVLKRRVALARKLAVAERLASPGPEGLSTAIEVLEEVLETPGLVPGMLDLAAMLNHKGAHIPGGGTPRIVIDGVEGLELGVREALADLAMAAGRWGSALEAAEAAMLLRERLDLADANELTRICQRCEHELARADGRPDPWIPRNGSAGGVSESDSPLRRLLRARGVSEAELIPLNLEAMLVDEGSLGSFEDEEPWHPLNLGGGDFGDDTGDDSEGDSRSHPVSSASEHVQPGAPELVDSQFLASTVKLSRTIAEQSLQGRQVEIVCAPTLEAIVAGSILAKAINAIRGESARRPRVLGFGMGPSSAPVADAASALRIFVGVPGRSLRDLGDGTSYSICNGECSIRAEDGQDLGSGTESEGGPALVAACIALSIASNGLAPHVSGVMAECAALAVLASVDGRRGWTLIRYFHRFALQGISAGSSFAIFRLLDGGRAEPMRAFHDLLGRFSGLEDLVRAGQGQWVAEALCSGQASGPGDGRFARMLCMVLSDDLGCASDVGVRSRLDGMLGVDRGGGLIEIPEGLCEASELPAIVGALSRESGALVVGFREEQGGRLVCHAASPSIPDMQRSLAPAIGLIADFLPTSGASRCDYVISAADRGPMLERLGRFVGDLNSRMAAKIERRPRDPEGSGGVFDIDARLEEVTGRLSMDCALLMPFSPRNPLPVVRVSHVTVSALQPFDEASDWKDWGWVELSDGVSAVRVLCFLGSESWQWMQSRFSGDLSHAVPMALELLLMSLPLQQIDGVVAFEVGAVRQADDHRARTRSELLRERINDVLSILTYVEREMVKLHYGIGDGFSYTLEEIGRIFKVPESRVQEKLDEAIEKLRGSERLGRLREVFSDMASDPAMLDHMRSS
jgi:hypothetical protein